MLKDKNGKSLTTKEVIKKAINRVKNWFVDFGLLLLRIVGCIPSHLVRKFCYRLVGIKIGKGSAIHTGARFFSPHNIVIGDDSIVGSDVFLDGRASLKIGSHVDIASEVMIYNSEHDINDPEFRAIESPVEIGDYVFVGPRAIILPGIKIGNGAIIAAGAVVTKDVGFGKVVGGIPAKEISERKLKNYSYKLGRPRLFQ